MPDEFASQNPGLTSPAADAYAVTPHDTNELAKWTRGIHVQGAGGDIALVTASGTTITVYIDKGGVLPIRAKIIKSTGTTATGIVGLV